jgi:hypothetical protein
MLGVQEIGTQVRMSECRKSFTLTQNAEVSSSAPHLLHTWPSTIPIMYRRLLRVLCPVRRPVTILDCILLKGTDSFFRHLTSILIVKKNKQSYDHENNQHDALYRLIYYSKSALHVSGDVFAHHQEHMNVFTVSGSVHPSCCRLVSRMSWNCSFNSFETSAETCSADLDQ